MSETIAKIHSLLSEAKWDDALLFAKRSYQSAQGDHRLLSVYVSMLIRRGMFDQARQVLDSSGFSLNQSPTARCLYTDLYRQTGNIEGLHNLEQTTGYSDELIARPTTDSFSSDNDFLQDKHIDGDFAKLLRRVLTDDHFSEPRLKQAYVQAKHGNVSDAKTIVKQWIKGHPRSRQAHLLNAEIALLDGRFTAASSRYQRLSKLMPDDPFIYRRRGDIAVYSGEIQEANEFYLKAIDLDPSDHANYLSAIRVCMLRGDRFKAKRIYNEAVTIVSRDLLAPAKTMILEPVSKTNANKVLAPVWTERGGDVMGIEYVAEPGIGAVSITGNIGIEMIESVNIAGTFCRMRLNQATSRRPDKDVSINASKALVYKDGPSAGLAFAMAIAGSFDNRTIPPDNAFTGEISLNGSVLPVGSIRSKLIAAYIYGVKRLFIPRANFSDLDIVPEVVKSSMNICLVGSFQEAYERIC